MRPMRLLALSLFCAASALAQVQERITVSLVEVPLTVNDRAGKPIRGLTAANFQVIDEGKQRPISSVDMIDFAARESLSAVSPLNPAARRDFMLLFDLSYASPQSMDRAQQAAREFLKTMTLPRDKIAVATIDVQRGFRLLTAFTTDREAVAAALDAPMTYRASDPLQLAGHETISDEAVKADSALSGKYESPMQELQRMANQADEQFNRQRIVRQVDLLGGLAKSLRSVNGRKHVVLLSEGFDPRLVQGRDAQMSEQQVRDTAAVEAGRIWEVDNDTRMGNTAAMSLVDRMGEMFRRSDVVLDAIDIKGVRVDVDAREGSQRKSNEGLFVLANATGGQVFKNGNVRDEFQRLITEQEVTYVLAFQAPASSPGRFHNLKVKLVNVPGGRVQARPGYYEAGGENMAERSLSNAEIVVNDIPQSAVHVSALVAPFPTTAANAQVPVILEVSGPDLLRATKNGAVTAEVFVYAFDDQGMVRDSLFQRMTFDMSKVGETLKATGMKYYGTLSLPPGKYAVKSLVRAAESDSKGFVRTDIVVPQPNELSVSQPFFYDSGAKWLMVKGSSHDKTNAAYPFEVDGESFIPSAAARVSKGQAHTFAVFVQNALPDEVTLETTPKATVVKQVKGTNGTKVVLRLEPTEQITSSLSIKVRKKGSADALSSTVPIIVQ